LGKIKEKFLQKLLDLDKF